MKVSDDDNKVTFDDSIIYMNRAKQFGAVIEKVYYFSNRRLPTLKV